MKKEITKFQKRVYVATKKIPRGRVATYAALARFIGKPKASRAVGNALSVNPFSPQVPCHRVVKSDGEVGGFAFGTERKIALLRKEGIKVENGRIKDFRSAIVNLR